MAVDIPQNIKTPLPDGDTGVHIPVETSLKTTLKVLSDDYYASKLSVLANNRKPDLSKPPNSDYAFAL
jgi:hypothetical protein